MITVRITRSSRLIMRQTRMEKGTNVISATSLVMIMLLKKQSRINVRVSRSAPFARRINRLPSRSKIPSDCSPATTIIRENNSESVR